MVEAPAKERIIVRRVRKSFAIHVHPSWCDCGAHNSSTCEQDLELLDDQMIVPRHGRLAGKVPGILQTAKAKNSNCLPDFGL